MKTNHDILAMFTSDLENFKLLNNIGVIPGRRVSDDVEKRSRQCLDPWNAVSTASDGTVVKLLIGCGVLEHG